MKELTNKDKEQLDRLLKVSNYSHSLKYIYLKVDDLESDCIAFLEKSEDWEKGRLLIYKDSCRNNNSYDELIHERDYQKGFSALDFEKAFGENWVFWYEIREALEEYEKLIEFIKGEAAGKKWIADVYTCEWNGFTSEEIKEDIEVYAQIKEDYNELIDLDKQGVQEAYNDGNNGIINLIPFKYKGENVTYMEEDGKSLSLNNVFYYKK